MSSASLKVKLFSVFKPENHKLVLLIMLGLSLGLNTFLGMSAYILSSETEILQQRSSTLRERLQASVLLACNKKLSQISFETKISKDKNDEEEEILVLNCDPVKKKDK